MIRDHVALAAYLEDREGWSFGYGEEPETHDCARFVAGAVLALTGRDPLAGFSGRWTTEAGAARVIRRHGGVAEAVSSVLTEVDPMLAQRGDVALAGEALCIVEGEMLIGLDRPRGYVRLPREAAVKTWGAG